MSKTFPVLRIRCSDAPGLVQKVSRILTDAGANILRNDEFVDRDSGLFFMRTAFETGHEAIVDAADLTRQIMAILPHGADIALQEPRAKRIVICATKEYHCLGDLLLRHKFGELGADILAVASNHDTLRDLVERFDIPFHHLPHHGQSREAHEDLLLDRLDAYAPDYVVLAKYMRILGPKIVNRYDGRLINIHHSFLPAFIGARPYHQAFARGVKMIGATAHFVTDDLDEGPIIAQQVVPIDHNDMADSMVQTGHEVETQTLANALKRVFDDRVFINGHKTVVFS